MSDNPHPLRNIHQNAFTIIQTSEDEFQRDLADLPVRYPDSQFTYISYHFNTPLIRFKEEYQDRMTCLKAGTLEDLTQIIEDDRSAVLFIKYNPGWFMVDRADLVLEFNECCRARARKAGPVVVLTSYMDRSLLKLDGKADYFYQVGKIRIRGKCLAIREQTRLDRLPQSSPGQMIKVKMCGQTKLEF